MLPEILPEAQITAEHSAAAHDIRTFIPHSRSASKEIHSVFDVKCRKQEKSAIFRLLSIIIEPYRPKISHAAKKGN